MAPPSPSPSAASRLKTRLFLGDLKLFLPPPGGALMRSSHSVPSTLSPSVAASKKSYCAQYCSELPE